MKIQDVCDSKTFVLTLYQK